MTILRSLAFITLSLAALNSCGKKAEPAPAPAPKAEAPAPKETNSTDELFDEFYDSTSADTASSEKSTAAVQEENSSSEPASVPEKKSAAPAKAKGKVDPDGRYVLQVSCVASEELAEKVAKKLEKTGYPVYVAEVKNPTPQLLGTYYRIRIGGFSDREAAKAFGEAQLTPNGFTYWVDKRTNDNVGASENSSSPAPAEKSESASAPSSGGSTEEW